MPQCTRIVIYLFDLQGRRLHPWIRILSNEYYRNTSQTWRQIPNFEKKSKIRSPWDAAAQSEIIAGTKNLDTSRPHTRPQPNKNQKHTETKNRGLK